LLIVPRESFFNRGSFFLRARHAEGTFSSLADSYLSSFPKASEFPYSDPFLLAVPDRLCFPPNAVPFANNRPYFNATRFFHIGKEDSLKPLFLFNLPSEICFIFSTTVLLDSREEYYLNSCVAQLDAADF